MWSEDNREHDDEHRASTSSEVMVMDERITAAAIHNVPNVSNLNISKSSRVHIGPKLVSVTQNINNVEMVKGRILGLTHVVSQKRDQRLRCSIAVFVCWAFIVATGLSFYLFYVILPKQRTRLDIGITEDWYLRRGDWQAMPAYDLEFLNLPLKNVIIGHTAANYCNQRYKCIERVLAVQQDHLQRGFYDIGPNFLVGGGGFVFEGRGANVLGAMIKSWNSKSITVMFLGDYTKDEPDQAQFEHVGALLDVLVKENVLESSYAIYGHCQWSPSTVSPGHNIMVNLKNFSHWVSGGEGLCLS